MKKNESLSIGSNVKVSEEFFSFLKNRNEFIEKINKAAEGVSVTNALLLDTEIMENINVMNPKKIQKPLINFDKSLINESINVVNTVFNQTFDMMKGKILTSILKRPWKREEYKDLKTEANADGNFSVYYCDQYIGEIVYTVNIGDMYGSKTELNFYPAKF